MAEWAQSLWDVEVSSVVYRGGGVVSPPARVVAEMQVSLALVRYGTLLDEYVDRRSTVSHTHAAHAAKQKLCCLLRFRFSFK